MKGTTLWRIGIGFGAGWILFDRFLHVFPDWLSTVVFMIAWALIIAGLLKERAKKI